MESITVDRHGRTAEAKKERRHTLRVAVNGLTYVNLAPDNGGIVLNVSEGGLCFQSRAPVHTVEWIRLWFSYRSRPNEARVGQKWPNEPSRGGVSRFIEVSSDLAWIDDTRKLGGLRFKNLPEEAREQIRDWMHEPILVHINEGPSQQFPSVETPSWSVKRASKSFAQLYWARLEELFSLIQTARWRMGFSGGLVSGILLSAVLVGLFSFLIKSHKLGDSLVQLGERLGGRPISTVTPAKSQESPSTSPTPQPVPLERERVSAEPKAVATPIETPPPEKLPAAAPPTVAQSNEEKPEAEDHGAPPVNRTVPRPSIPRTVIDPATAPDENMLLAAAPEPEMSRLSRLEVHSEPLKVVGAITAPEKYLEVGKFKQKPFADTLVDRVSQLDFPAKVSQNSRFFGKSYQVLVGPYGSDSEAEAVHKELSSHGLTPRSYERGKRDFLLRSGLKVGATRLPVGDCVISWESYMPDTIVKIETLRGPSVTLEGKWVSRSNKWAENAIAYVKDRDGYLSLVEIRFSGLTETLVFDGESKR